MFLFVAFIVKELYPWSLHFLLFWLWDILDVFLNEQILLYQNWKKQNEKNNRRQFQVKIEHFSAYLYNETSTGSAPALL